MAGKKSSLEKIAEAAAEGKKSKEQGITAMPAGTPDKVEQNQLTIMDVITGICSAGLFGLGNQNYQSNFNQIIANPEKSYLGRILTYLKLVSKGTNKIFKQLLTNDQKSINVTLSGLNNSNMGMGDSKILLSVDENTNITDLNNQLEHLKTITNDPDLMMGIQGICDVFVALNKSKIETENFSESIKSISITVETLSTAMPNLKENIKKLNEIFVNPEEFKLNIPNLIPEESVTNNLENFAKYINQLSQSFNTLDNALDKDKVEQFKESINSLNTKLSGQIPDFTNLGKFIESIDQLLKGKENLNNAKGLGELMSSIIKITAIKDIKIDQKSLNELSKLLVKGGQIDIIIKEITALGNRVGDNSKAAEALKIITVYFNAVSSLVNLGMFDRLRIMSNISFFKSYINEELPGLMNDIETKFKGVEVSSKNNALYNLQNYFGALKSIASISLKEQLQIILFMKFMKGSVVDAMAELMKEIQEKLGNISLSESTKGIMDFFKTITTISIGDFEDQQENLNALSSFILGSSILGSKKLGAAIDKLAGDASIIGILEELCSRQDIINNAAQPIKLLEKTFDSISSMLAKHGLNEEDMSDYADALKIFRKGILNEIIKIGNDKEIEKDLNAGIQTISKFVEAIIDTFPKDKEINKVIKKILIKADTAKDFKETMKFFKQLNLMAKLINSLDNVKISQTALKSLDKLADALKVVINKFNKLNPKKVKAATKLLNSITMFLLLCAGTLFLASAAMVIVPWHGVFKFLLGIIVMVTLTRGLLRELNSKSFNERQLTGGISKVFQISLLFLSLGLTMALCSRLMSGVEIEDIAKFGIGMFGMLVMAGLLIYGLSLIPQKNMVGAITNAGQLAILIVACGISVGIAAMLGKDISFGTLIAFGLSIMILIVGVMVPIIFFQSVKILMFNGIKDLGILVLSCAAALALAGFVVQFINKGTLILFTALLTFMVSGIVAVTGMFGKKEIKGAADLGKLVLYSALGLIIGGALFTLWPELIPGVITFGLILFTFVAGLTLVIGIASKIAGKKGQNTMAALHKIILWSSVCLLMGGMLFTLWPDLVKGVLKFAAILFLFILGVSLSVAIVGRFMKAQVMKQMWQLSLLILIAALAITVGPIMLKHFDVHYDDVLYFVLLSLLMTVGMVGIVKLMSMLDPEELFWGIIGTALLELLIAGLGLAFIPMIPVLDMIGKLKFWDVILALFTMGAIIAGVIALVTIIGIAMMGPQAAIFAAGAAALGWLEALIGGLGLCMIAIGFAMEKIVAVNDMIGNRDMFELLKPVGDFLAASFAAIWDNISLKESGFFMMVMPSILGLTMVLSLLSNAIQDYANLKAPIYDENGNIKGYRQLNEDDFKNAAKNIATIILTVGGAIMGLFGIGPYGKDMSSEQKEVALEMLKVEPGGLFRSSKTKFGMIVEASAGLGKVIKEIAEGAMTYTQLPKEFDAAKTAANIATIILNVGGAIMGLFGLGPYGKDISSEQKEVALEMLKVEPGGWFRANKTKFGMIVEACAGLGKIVSEIGEGAMKFSQLPEGFDAGKISTVVGDIVTVLGNALIELYDRPIGKEMFTTDNIFTGNNKFKRVADSVGQLGSMISNIMEGVQSYANLKIPIKWDEEGKPIDFKPMTDVEFLMAQFNIGRLVTTLGDALIKVGESPAFSNIFGGAKIKQISEAIANVAGVISPIANAIWMYAEGKFPIVKYVDGELKTVGYYSAKDHGGMTKMMSKVSENIKSVIKGFAVVFNNLLKDDELKKLINNPKDTLKLTESLTNITALVNSTFESIGKILQTPVNSSIIESFITKPFTAFIDGVMWAEADENKDRKYWIRKNPNWTEDYIKGIKSLVGAVKDAFVSLNEIIGYGITEDQLKIIGLGINEYTNVLNDVNEDFTTKANVLKDGITAIYQAFSEVNKNTEAEARADTLKNYIESVNSLDVSKVESLTTLAYAVTDLGNKIGNIDKFTDILADKISVTLQKLTKQIKDSEKVINKAEELHKKRKSTIAESVSKITELMNKSMIVEIKNDQQATALDETGTVSNGSPGLEGNTNTPNVPVDTIPDNEKVEKPGGGGNNKQYIPEDTNYATLQRIITNAIRDAKKKL